MFQGALVYGLVNSAMLTLYALGFNLTFGISGIANFAYGSLYVLTGYTAWIVINSLHLPVPVALPVAVAVTAVLAGGIYRFLLVRLRGYSEAEVIATFGCGLVILETLRYFGFIGLQFSLPVFWDGSLRVAGLPLDYQRIFILSCGFLLTAGLYLFTHHTRVGRAFRAMAQDERTAICLGIDPDRMSTWAMTLGGALCAVAAVVILPTGNISVDGGYEVLLEALAVCIVGGLGSTAGVIVSGFILGMSRTFAAMYIGSHWMMIVTLAAILLVLFIKPSGLLSRQSELEDRT